jgi:hypothetical protein
VVIEYKLHIEESPGLDEARGAGRSLGGRSVLSPLILVALHRAARRL